MNYSLFVVFHSKLHENQYTGKEDHFIFGKVGDYDLHITSDKIRSRVLDIHSLPGYVEKGKHWAESEFLIAIYNTMLMKGSASLEEVPFIGFMQYDHATKSTANLDLISFIDNTINNLDDKTAISLVPIDMKTEIYSNHIAMDFSDKQKLQGDPICYFPMISDYNKYYGTTKSYMDLIQNQSIALCSSFVMKSSVFMRMMEFCIWSGEKNDLDSFDPARKHRLSGGLMERYYGCWMALSEIKLIEFPLVGLSRIENS